jgi:polyisoprenoid-binding protein YceI
MKMKLVISLISMSVILFAFKYQPILTYNINAEASSLRWTGYHLAKSYQHTGEIKIKTGSLQVDNGELVSGEVIIDMNSITNEDLTKEKDNIKLVKDLKSERFFNAAEYPEASLEILNSNKTGDNAYEITANMTIRGITEEIKFSATKEESNNSLTFKANIEIDRTKHEVMYGWSIENAILGNTFDLEVNIVADKMAN